MSKTGIEAVLARAMSNATFAEQLFTNAEQALTEFDLTTDEITWFKSMSRAEFEKTLTASPEDRKSFGALWVPPGPNHNETVLMIIE